MNTVWILIALVSSDYMVNSIVPTLEFKTQQTCEAAIVAFKQETQHKSGSANMRCVRIEK